jgi:hypothetical protein
MSIRKNDKLFALEAKVFPSDPRYTVFHQLIKPSLSNTMLNEKGDPVYRCSLCNHVGVNVTFSFYYAYTRHLKRFHRNDLPCDGQLFDSAIQGENDHPTKSHHHSSNQSHISSSKNKKRSFHYDNDVFTDESPNPLDTYIKHFYGDLDSDDALIVSWYDYFMESDLSVDEKKFARVDDKKERLRSFVSVFLNNITLKKRSIDDQHSIRIKKLKYM